MDSTFFNHLSGGNRNALIILAYYLPWLGGCFIDLQSGHVQVKVNDGVHDAEISLQMFFVI